MNDRRPRKRNRQRNRRRDAGVPRAVERAKAGKPVVDLDIAAARTTWLLDVLAWARHGVVAARIDLRGPRAALPPVVLPAVGDDRVVALEPAAALDRLRSRHRAFSQMAGRYSPLVIGSRDAGRGLAIEIWALGEVAIDAERLAEQLAEYMQADVTVHDRQQAAAIVADIDWSTAPPDLLERNPLAWGWALQHGADGGP